MLFSPDGPIIDNFNLLFSTKSLVSDIVEGKLSLSLSLSMVYEKYYRHIHYMVSHVLFPRKLNHGDLMRNNVVVTWFLANNIDTN